MALPAVNGQVIDAADVNAKLSTATAAATYAPLASPSLTGTVTLNGVPLTAGGSGVIDARSFGTLKLDAKRATDVVATASGTTITSATATWKVGNKISIRKAGSLNADSQPIPHVATITAVAGTTATLSVATPTAGTGLHAFYGTDDTAAWNAILDTLVGDNLVPTSWIVDAGPVFVSLVSDTLSVPRSVKFLAERIGLFDPQRNPIQYPVGPTFAVIGHPTNPAIRLGRNSGDASMGLGNCVGYYVNQMAYDQKTPRQFGAFLEFYESAAGCHVPHIFVPNAWRGVNIRGGRHKFGHISIGAFDAGVTIDRSLDFTFIDTIQASIYWQTCEGVAPDTAVNSLTAFAQGASGGGFIPFLVYRSDSFHVSRIVAFRSYAPFYAGDSPDTVQPDGPSGSRCGYGQIDQIDADYVTYGIVVTASGDPGIQVGSVMISANPTTGSVGMPGVAGIALVAGGTRPARLKVVSLSTRGSFSNGITSAAGGTTYVGPSSTFG